MGLAKLKLDKIYADVKKQLVHGQIASVEL